MNGPLVSIVLPTHKRPKLLASTLDSIEMQTYTNREVIVVEDGYNHDGTEDLCRKRGVKYFCRRNRPRYSYSNPAIPKNIGIKQATGQFLIIQCAEVRYTAPQDIENLLRPLREARGISNFALVKALDDQGGFQEWYAGPNRAPKWFLDFCQAAYLSDVLAIGGFDEDFYGYGFDDDQFALRMQASGVKYQWAMDVVCEHQWHPIYDKDVNMSEAGRTLYNRTKLDLETGKRGPQANVGRSWGELSS